MRGELGVDHLRRLSSVGVKLRREPLGDLARRALRRAYLSSGAESLDFPLLPGDVASSVGVEPELPGQVVPPPDGPLRIGWMCTPPGRGSGGHTTMFRMIRSLEEAGHLCTVLLYDRHRGDPRDQAALIREEWPWVRAEITSVDHGFGGLDACFATSWPTAHVLARRGPARLLTFYFIQDYEPYFYPHGSEHELAADSYRLGHTNVALGPMVQNRLREEIEVASEIVPFCCDTQAYALENRGTRSGVVFYAKPGVPRRGYQLGALALQEFHALHPEQEIHLFGDPVRSIPVPVTRHGHLSVADLSSLYNQSVAGLALSFTNITLVAEEMLVAGCIPVANDSQDSRDVVSNPHVVWTEPSPVALARGLCRAVEDPDVAGHAVRAAQSVEARQWSDAGTALLGIVESRLGRAGSGRTRVCAS